MTIDYNDGTVIAYWKGMMQKSMIGRYTILCLVVLLISLGEVWAKVTGNCSNCHTMHNSQGGQPVAYQLNLSLTGFESNPTPNQMLLVSNCIGCHTSTGSTTIVNNTPIVFNTSIFNNPLAGGNFKYVTTDDLKGHNVAGIKAQDGTLGLTPPGGTTMTSQLTCAGEFGCHGDRSSGKDNYTGLKGGHHTDDTGGITGNSVGLSYRFLKGILGKEDSNWEQDNINTSHNEYKGSTSSSTDTLSYLCAQCHGSFHTWVGGASQVGTASPWLRHPTDVVLKSTGEYASYTTYSMVSPVARPNPNSVPNTSTVYPGTDIIMCLSCHRVHASPYFKIMRWNYKGTTLLSPIPDPDTDALYGCVVCHTSKN